MSDSPQIPERCAAFQDALQAYLDGGAAELSAEQEAHRLECLTCCGDFAAARRLRTSLLDQPSVVVPAGLADRIVAAVVERRAQVRGRVRQTVALILATAACLVLAVGIGSWPRHRAPEGPAPAAVEVASRPDGEPVSVDSTVAEAAEALTSLTRRAIGSPLEAAPAAPRLDLTPPAMPDPMGPAAQSLSDVGRGASSGLEPVTRTARRAFDLFLRDAPVRADRNPDS